MMFLGAFSAGPWFLYIFIFISRFCASLPSSSRLNPRDAGDLCHVVEPQVALIDDRLYFMRGNYSFDGQSPGPESKIYWIDLNSTFPVEEPIPIERYGSVDIPEDLTPFVTNQSARPGPLFYTNDTIYMYAGMGDAGADNVLPAFDTLTEDWSAISVEGGDFNVDNRIDASVATDLRTGLSFALGGDLSRYHFGMIRFDGSDRNAPRWTNETVNDVSGGTPVPSVIEGALVYLPMGGAGVLVGLGGYDSSQPGIQYGDNFGYDQIPMHKISVYDIENAAWYSLNAYGNVPGNRSEFCTAVSAAPDYSSFQITVYGGFDLSSFRSNEDVYVLSVPSFRWFRVTQTDNFEAQDPAVGRSAHACVTYNDAQMVVLGGQNGNTEQSDVGCSSPFPPLRVLDTSTYTWKTDFDPSRTYSVPSFVYDVIGGDASGNALQRGPENGFNLSALDTLFSKTLPNLPDSQADSENQDPASPQEGDNDDSKTPVGAIAGGVVGGVAFIAVAALLFIFLRRRQRRQRRPNLQEEVTAELPTKSALHEMPGTTKSKPVEVLTPPPAQELYGSDPGTS